MSKAADEVQRQRNRADFMDYLYERYDRANAYPGLRGTYTGLAIEHRAFLGRPLMDAEIDGWHENSTFIKGLHGIVQ